jgi:LPXTG-motif cell wall-anchored protein
MRATLPTMPRARTVAIALTAAALAAPGSALGQGSSGAGDEQYTDPLAGGEETTQTTGSQSGDGLTQDPDLGTSGSQTTTPTTTPTTSGETVTTSPTTSLPNTGSDPRLIILAGLALLLSGLGLRLRTADEVF